MLKQDCLFCKIIAGEIPSHKVYEDSNVLAFLDIHPCTKGHTVVVPKRHVLSFFEVGGEEFDKVVTGIMMAARRVNTVLTPDGLNVAINDRPAAGQTVPHAHWHILPRWQGDGGGSAHSIIRSKEPIDVKAVAELFE